MNEYFESQRLKEKAFRMESKAIDNLLGTEYDVTYMPTEDTVTKEFIMPTIDGKELSQLKITVNNNLMGGNCIDYWGGWAVYKEPIPDVDNNVMFEDNCRIGQIYISKKYINEFGVYMLEFIGSGELRNK